MSHEQPPGGDGVDHLRPSRRGLAKVVLLFDSFLALIPLILVFSALSAPRGAPRSPLLWIGWVLAAGPIAGSAVFAVRLLRTRPDEERESQAGWTGGLFGLGIAILCVTGVLSSDRG